MQVPLVSGSAGFLPPTAADDAWSRRRAAAAIIGASVALWSGIVYLLA